MNCAPPLLYRAATGRCEFLTASGVAMGLFEGADYAVEEEFGEERLGNVSAQNASRPAEELAGLIVGA